MPELGELTRALNDDLNAVRWPEAPQIRGRGQQRQRRGRLLAVAVVAAVAVAGIGAAGLTHPSAGSQHPAAPGASGQLEDPARQDDPQLRTSAIEFAVMANAMLAPQDIATGAVQNLGGSGASPLGECSDDTMLAAPDYLLSLQTWFTAPAGGQVDEEITWYRPDSAVVGIRDDLTGRLAGACKDIYSPVASGFAGDASQMIAVQAQSMPPRVEVFVANRDYLIWLRVAGPFDNLHDYARQLAQRTVAKLNCAITGQSPC